MKISNLKELLVWANKVISFCVFCGIGLLFFTPQLANGANMIEKAEVLRKNPLGFFPTAVVVFPNRVYLPNRTLLDVSNSLTSGLQEAVDYAFREGYDLFVYGSPTLGQPGIFNLRRPLNFPFIQTKTIRFFQTHLKFSNEVTSYALSIDSAMVVDILMTGLIDAPSASTGILFRGTKPLPLDGPIFGAIGITSSRFHFDTIIANGPKVTFDTTARGPSGQVSSINANSFYFAGTQPAEIRYLGSHFSKDNIFDSAGSARGYNIYIDVFDTNRVNVLPPDTSLGLPVRVFTPHGQVNTANSRTTGLQEAINTAIRYNWDLVVYGIGFSNNLRFNPDNTLNAEDAQRLARGFYWLRDMLIVPSVRGRMFRMFNVNLNWAPFSGAIYNPSQQVFIGAGIKIQDAEDFDFEITGQMNARYQEVGLFFQPRSWGIRRSSFRVGSGSSVLFDINNASVERSSFYFSELLGNDGYYGTANGSTSPLGDPSFGLRIGESSRGFRFAENFLRATLVHGHTNVAIQLGNRRGQSIYANTIQFATQNDDVVTRAAVQVYGQNNTLTGGISSSGRGHTLRGFSFDEGSFNNNVYLYQNESRHEPFVEWQPHMNQVKRIPSNF